MALENWSLPYHEQYFQRHSRDVGLMKFRTTVALDVTVTDELTHNSQYISSDSIVSILVHLCCGTFSKHASVMMRLQTSCFLVGSLVGRGAAFFRMYLDGRSLFSCGLKMKWCAFETWWFRYWSTSVWSEEGASSRSQSYPSASCKLLYQRQHTDFFSVIKSFLLWTYHP